MYPYGRRGKGNHPKSVCFDGVPQRMPAVPSEHGRKHVDFPQPAGIFLQGKQFSLVKLLQTVARMYKDVVLDGTLTPVDAWDLEYEVFAEMLNDRTETAADGVVWFRTFPQFTIIDTQLTSDLYRTDVDGVVWARIDSLSSARDGVTAAGANAA